jgi:hypothetical protein
MCTLMLLLGGRPTPQERLWTTVLLKLLNAERSFFIKFHKTIIEL